MTTRPDRHVLITPGRVLVAPLGTARPDEDVPWGTVPTGYERLGLLSQSIKISFERTVQEKMVENALGKIGQQVTAESLTVETGIAEFRLKELQYAWGGIYTHVPAGASQKEYETLEGGGDICIPSSEWLLEFQYPGEECGGLPFPLRLAFIGEASKGGGTVELGKTNQTEIPLMISASHDTDMPLGKQLFKWLKVLADATS